MKKDKSFTNKFVPEMIKRLSDKIIDADVGSFIQSAPNSDRPLSPLSCSMMSMFKLNIEYNHKVSVGINYVNVIYLVQINGISKHPKIKEFLKI